MSASRRQTSVELATVNKKIVPVLKGIGILKGVPGRTGTVSS